MAKKKSIELPEPAADAPAKVAPYLVLARKYRPQTFDDLIGQEAMVRTLRNAFATGRIAQAYMLTGVRGVGKTTTARILARALNYERHGQSDGPTFDMPELGRHCLEIMESRHPDVLEMDAASNTSIDNVREIIESVRYRPLSARNKVFIIDEVHMLSKGAFNALLKTLEEPPPHVKFIFATTEIRKVPVTVLSRCQRFDLRRVDQSELVAHYRRIAEREGIAIKDEALRLIARAAEGSVRDGLSILDQAFSTAGGEVAEESVRAMLGLADRTLVLDLLETVLSGRTKEALQKFAGLHGAGAEPMSVLAELADAVHIVTRMRVAGPDQGGALLSEVERSRCGAMAERLSIGLLSRAWQMLLAGLEEGARSSDARAAAEMLLIRVAHMAELPPPEEIVRRLGLGGAGVPGGTGQLTQPAGSSGPQAEARDVPASDVAPPTPESKNASFRSFSELVAFVGTKRDALLKIALEEQVRLVRFEPPTIELNVLPGAESTLAGDLAEKLKKWTGERWMVTLSRSEGERPMGEVRREREATEIEALCKRPEIERALKTFPDAKITAVRPIENSDADEPANGAARPLSRARDESA